MDELTAVFIDALKGIFKVLQAVYINEMKEDLISGLKV